MDDIGLEPLNENIGGLQVGHARETNGARAAILPNNKAVPICDSATGTSADRMNLQDIARLLQMCKQAVATLIDATPIDDTYALETLGPILGNLKTAQSAIERLGGN